MKKQLILITVALFCFTGVAISAERDCSNPKKISEKLLCKMKGASNKDGEKKSLFKTPKILQKLNKWSAENKTLMDLK